MKAYQVWIQARHPQQMHVIAEALVFEHEDRLCCERFNEKLEPREQVAFLNLFGHHVERQSPLYNGMVRPYIPPAPAAKPDIRADLNAWLDATSKILAAALAQQSDTLDRSHLAQQFCECEGDRGLQGGRCLSCGRPVK